MSYMLEALSGSVQASALDLSQNGIATLEFQDKHRRLYHVSTLMVGRLGDLWEWIVLNHQQAVGAAAAAISLPWAGSISVGPRLGATPCTSASAAAAARGTVAMRGGNKTAHSPGEAQPCSLFGSLTAFSPGEVHRPPLKFTPGVASPIMARAREGSAV